MVSTPEIRVDCPNRIMNPVTKLTDLVFVSPARTAELLYEVTAAAPFQGRNGCGTIDAFDIPLSGIFPVSLKPVKVIGRFAPVDGTKIASPTAPEPRFIP